MQIVVPPPTLGGVILVGVPILLAVVALLVMRGRPLVARIVPVAIAVVVSATLWKVAMQPMRFSWDAQGVTDGTFQDERRIAWGDMRDARVVKSFGRTEWCPKRRTHGTYYSGNGSGDWGLANGDGARVFFLPGSSDALVFTAGGQRYVWAPVPFAPFLETAKAHARVSE